MTDDECLRIEAVELEQQGKKMYVFTTDGQTLFDMSTVSRREENKETGYQRNLREARARSIASYLDAQQGLIPNNFIINFEPSVVYHDGQLVIPPDPDIAWVIDGQHRLYGLHLAQTDLPVSVLAFIGLSVQDQAALFIKINRTQKGVPSSLYLVLLPLIGDEESLERKVRDLVSLLNSEEDSPWYDNVNMTGEGKGDISLANFTRKLRPLIDPDRGVLRTYTFEEQYKIIRNYFEAIKSVFLDQWRDRRRVLTKTLGFGALMNAFPDIFSLTRERKGGFAIPDIVDTFELIRDFQFDSHTLGAGTGTKAEAAAGKIIVERITECVRESEPASGLIRLD